jgi:hypothetical protein
LATSSEKAELVIKARTSMCDLIKIVEVERCLEQMTTILGRHWTAFFSGADAVTRLYRVPPNLAVLFEVSLQPLTRNMSFRVNLEHAPDAEVEWPTNHNRVQLILRCHRVSELKISNFGTSGRIMDARFYSDNTSVEFCFSGPTLDISGKFDEGSIDGVSGHASSEE